MEREWALGRFRRLVLESRKQPRVGEHALERVQRRPIWRWRSRWRRVSSLVPTTLSKATIWEEQAMSGLLRNHKILAAHLVMFVSPLPLITSLVACNKQGNAV